MRGDVNVSPGRMDQIRATDDASWVILDADAGGVVADLKKLDKGLEVRFSKRQECWVIFHRHHDGCPHNGTGGPGSTYLIRTVEAYRSPTGIWTGLDDRIVKRFEQIDPFGRGGYDYAQELENATLRARDEKRRGFAEKVGEAAERAAHALRHDLGLGSYKGRIFRP